MAAKIVLLFVGRTGNGKSSTANSLIGDKFFSTGKQCDDFNLNNKTAELEGFKITVIDGTGIGDTGADMNGDIQDTIQKAKTALQICESGFNALIFVMAYGIRFTKQEKDAVDLIKSLFGRDIFRRFGVIVMSRGDQFEMDTEDNPKTFDQWCREQTGAIRDFFQECDYRVVIFNNISKDKKTLDRQRRELLGLVYSRKDYKLGVNYRQRLMMNYSFLEAEKLNNKFLKDIDKQLHHLESDKVTHQYLKKLTKISLDLENKFESIKLTFSGSEHFSALWKPLETRFLKVKLKIRFEKDCRRELTEGYYDDGKHSVTEVKIQGSQSLPQASQNVLKTNIIPDNKNNRESIVVISVLQGRGKPQSNTDCSHPTPRRAQYNRNGHNEASSELASPGGFISDSKRATEGYVSDLKSDGRGQAGWESRVKAGASQDPDLVIVSEDRRQPVVTQQLRPIVPRKSNNIPENNAPQPTTKGPCFYMWCCTCCCTCCCTFF